MTRSGVFNSVHSFTQSAIGPTFLVFLAAALLFSVALLALAHRHARAPKGASKARASREATFLVNNLLFVLLHVHGAARHGVPARRRGGARRADERRRAVLRPHGRADRRGAAVPDGRRAGAAVGPRDARRRCGRRSLPPLAGARASSPSSATSLGVRNPWTLVTLAFGGYAAQVTLARAVAAGAAADARGESVGARSSTASSAAAAAASASYVVHAGVVVVIVAIAVSSTMRTADGGALHEGADAAGVGGYDLTFRRRRSSGSEPHRSSIVGALRRRAERASRSRSSSRA